MFQPQPCSPAACSPPLSRSLTPSGAVTPNRPKTRSEWFRSSQLNFRQVQLHGSSSPIIWVPVEGKVIPKNAILAGENRYGPLYIARAFYEGGVYIGQAGPQLNCGAVIPFKNRAVEVSMYEVAVHASLQPLHYGLTEVECVVQPVIPVVMAPIATQTPEEMQLRRINDIKTVIIVDDSMSMGDENGRRWNEAQEALAGVAELAERYGAEGADIYFLSNTRVELCIRGSAAVRALFNSVCPEGETDIGQKLQEVFNIYIPRLENRAQPYKPIAIVVITDGEPTDDPQRPIIDAAYRLDANGVPVNQLRLHFAQIGDDPDATRVLNELSTICKNSRLRDFVDTTPYDPIASSFTTQSITRILLRSIEKVIP